MKGLTILEILIIVIVIAALAAIVAPNFMDQGHRHHPGFRVRSDQRTLATALEAYYIDNNTYPDWTVGALGANADAAPGTPHAAMPTFRVKQGPDDPLETLTTPVPYVTSYLADPFATKKADGATYAYWIPQVEDDDGNLVNRSAWILWSPGPDKDFDITDPAAVYDGTEATPSSALLQLTYDPTNGTESSGDVYRLKQ